MKTTSKALEAVFDLLAEEFKAQLRDGKIAYDKNTGEEIKLSPDAATLNVIRQFLKDQGIEAIGEKSDQLGDLAASLPFNSDISHDPERPN